jgi:hypothetical protein
MNIGIVGHEEAKFTQSGKLIALAAIAKCLKYTHPAPVLISGGCHLGGIDIWAEEFADRARIPKTIFKPQRLTWDSKHGQIGFKERNIQIAQASDVLYCIAVQRLASSYGGMQFTECYHCNKTDHVKGGGCWTMKVANALGKETHLIIIPNQED